MKWVSSFNPENINSNDLILPNELKKMSGFTKKLVTELDSKEKRNKRNHSYLEFNNNEFYDKTFQNYDA